MVKVFINKFDVDWEVDVNMWFEGSTVFLSFLGEIYIMSDVDDLEDSLTEDELKDFFFEDFRDDLEYDFKPDIEDNSTMSDLEFYSMKF